MSEKRGRGRPKFEPNQDQRSQVKLMNALGVPEDRICKTITNPRTRKPVAPMTRSRGPWPPGSVQPATDPPASAARREWQAAQSILRKSRLADQDVGISKDIA
jgi:hypothetical protein